MKKKEKQEETLKVQDLKHTAEGAPINQDFSLRLPDNHFSAASFPFFFSSIRIVFGSSISGSQ